MYVLFVCLKLFRQAIVEELASSGAKVYTCALEQDELDQSLQKWNDKGYKVFGMACNLMVREEREKLMKAVGNHFNGKLDMLVSYMLIIYLEENDLILSSSNDIAVFNYCFEYNVGK